MGVNADTDGSGKGPLIIYSARLDLAAASLQRMEGGIPESGSAAERKNLDKLRP